MIHPFSLLLKFDNVPLVLNIPNEQLSVELFAAVEGLLCYVVHWLV